MQGARGRVQGAVPGAGCPVRGAVPGAGCRVRRAGLGAVLLAAFCLQPAALAAQAGPGVPASDLPDGDGVGIARARCLSCHGDDLITSQRLTEAGWGRELDKMGRWGAAVQDAERPALLAYLTRHFGAEPVASHTPADAGQAIFTRSCLSCHGADLTEQQRLSPTGWTREVEKMMRWGASVTDAEKADLVAYLAARFPVR